MSGWGIQFSVAQALGTRHHGYEPSYSAGSHLVSTGKAPATRKVCGGSGITTLRKGLIHSERSPKTSESASRPRPTLLGSSPGWADGERARAQALAAFSLPLEDGNCPL